MAHILLIDGGPDHVASGQNASAPEHVRCIAFGVRADACNEDSHEMSVEPARIRD